VTALKRILAVIPARYGSTRLPGKPLKPICGKPLVQWVYEGVARSELVTDCVVATDDDRIVAAVEEFGGRALKSDQEFPNGSERTAWCAAELVAEEAVRWDTVVNVQGDIPFLIGKELDSAISMLAQGGFELTTVASPITKQEDYHDPSVVKVVVGALSQALYFSRAPVPHARDAVYVPPLKHIGLYVFKPDFLKTYASLPVTPIEQMESLEQLRVLAHGFRIGVSVSEEDWLRQSVEVDTEEGLAKAEELARAFDKLLAQGGKPS